MMRQQNKYGSADPAPDETQHWTEGSRLMRHASSEKRTKRLTSRKQSGSRDLRQDKERS